MFDAQTIQSKGQTATELYSPWFPRGGDYGLFTLELIAVDDASASLTLDVELWHKNSSETGDGAKTTTLTFQRNGSQLDRTTVDFAKNAGSPAFTGFEELVRYKYILDYASGTALHWATFRMLAPIWYDNV